MVLPILDEPSDKFATTGIDEVPQSAPTKVWVLEEICCKTRITLMDNEYPTEQAARDEAAHRILLVPAAFQGPIELRITEVTR